MSNPLTSYFGVSAVAMPLRDQRMKLIASNLANADTPNYKARDIAFDDVLRQAAGTAAPLQTTDARHMNGLNLQPQLFERTPLQPSLDGNTVDPDIERAAYGRAALEYRASLSFVESKTRTLMTAITGE
jgi:flagellar basal-body rod protein FlgB